MDDGVLRCRAAPQIPTFPDSDGSLNDECNQGHQQQGNGGTQVTSNRTFEVEQVISRKLQLKRKAEYLKSDLMHQFDCQVNDFVDSLIEESAVLEPAPVPDVFSPPLTEKERSKLGCCPATPTCL